MSTTNYPSADISTTNENIYNKPPKKDFRYVIYTLLSLGLISALGYIWFSKKTEKENDVKQQQALVISNTKADDNEASYKSALVTLDSITSLNTTLNSEITNKDGNIARLKGEIENILRQKASSGKISSQEEATLRNKIAQLNNEISGYKNRVTELEQQNQALTQENTSVKTQRDSVITEKEKVRTDLDRTVVEKKQLEEKVDVGATLNANNFNIEGINERRNGKEKATDKAKKVDKLRIGFDLDANRITQSGKKQIYISITAPDGSPVTVEALGSGKMNTKEEGEKFYTTTMDVDYTQGQKKYVNFDWKQNSDFLKGDYKVEVYQNGFKIGDGKVTLKKSGFLGL
jgi:regulator of replication initiation timing